MFRATGLIDLLYSKISRHRCTAAVNYRLSSCQKHVKCDGCGSIMQSSNSHSHGYLLERHSTGNDDSASRGKSTICQRCIYLKHHNTALDTGPVDVNISEYKEHIASLSAKKALILVVIDAIDFPGSLFPNLDIVVGNKNPVHIVANKVDLLPNSNNLRTLQRLEKYISSESLKGTGEGFSIGKTWFTSSKTGKGIKSLSDWIVNSWGNRGDVYLMGCTNVGKSSLFHQLMIQLCGSLPGDNETISGLRAPSPVVSCWPGTTLDLISFPILSVGKRRRLLSQFNKIHSNNDVLEENEGKRIRDLAIAKKRVITNPGVYDCLPDIEDVLMDIGLKRTSRQESPPPPVPTRRNKDKSKEQTPLNRRWLHDTPGAIDDARLINHLTTKELTSFLPKRPLLPRTFILKPGSTLFIGGLARLDYHEGTVSAYFSVFCSSSIPLHTSQIHKADSLYEGNLGKPLLKIPFGDEDRLGSFPHLQPQSLTITGCGLHQCSFDIILSSIGWVSMTLGNGQVASIKVFTVNGKGVWLRDPSLVPEAIKERGRRSQKGNRTAFTGKK